ncbi:MAG: response regulator transcription factor [Candidatus Obscuribacterales bacterium]|nr:response regulator transcription factor [Candidatus Obscuribacterales bacterium]
MPKILLVEDNEENAIFLKELLLGERYLVDHIDDGQEALLQLQCAEYDLLILDWQLPKVSGIEICRQYRAKGGKAPVIMLTGKLTDVDKETGLDAGADDYLTKPYSLKELLARLRALLRRVSLQQDAKLVVADVEMDTANFLVTKGGVEIPLLPKEFALLEFFMRNTNKVFSSDALLQRVWDTDSEASSNALRSAMRRLRQKLGEDGDNSIIENIHGVGYRMRGK